MRRAKVALASMALLLTVASAAATPLDDLIARAPGNGACFSRAYDAAHLRKNPKQTTTSIAVWLSYDRANGNPPVLTPPGLGITIRQRGDSEPWFAQGGCDWDEGVNRDVQDRPLIKNFKKTVGISCTMLARPDVFDVSSAEEGGLMILDRGKDKDTLTVYLDNGLAMVKRADRARDSFIKFGADDRVFVLHRSDAKDCAGVVDAVSTPEPATPRR
jgi:hypothetical protein